MLKIRLLAKATLMCDARRGDGVSFAGVQCDERINGSSRLMEGGGPTRSPLSGASCNRAGSESLRLGGGAVFHVLNVAILISAAESRGWFGCHLLGLCFWNTGSVHLNSSLSFSSHPRRAAASAERLPAVQMLDMTTRGELTNSCCSLNLCLYLLTIKEETFFFWE